jgi:hypothetical protein
MTTSFKPIIAFVLVNLVAGYGIFILGSNIYGIYAAFNKQYLPRLLGFFGVAWTINVFFLPTVSMLIFTILAMYYSYNLDTTHQSPFLFLKSGRSIFASLFGWSLVAPAVGYGIWMMN